MFSQRITTLTKTSIIGFALASSVAACSTPSTQSYLENSVKVAQNAPSTPAPVAHFGAKKSIAVAKFDANGAFLDSYGGWDVGGGLSAIMVSELEGTGAFRVVNRADIDATLYEQSLSLQGLTATDTVKAGQLVGAQYLIRGSVTEFSQNKKGGGISIGGDLGGLFTGISPQRRTAHVGIDVSVINATTGEVVSSTTVKREFKRTALGASVSGDGWRLSGNKFESTVLGEAAREAIHEAVANISNNLSGKAWTAQVAQVKGNTLYVNAGEESGLKLGDTLTISRVTERVIDPVTGALLGLEDKTLGTATISEVKEQYAKATFSSNALPKTGDTLELVQTPRLTGLKQYTIALR